MSNELIPNYLDIDYNTIVTKIKEELSKSSTFNDYNYEGSNISLLIELMAYIGELNTYFLNKISKNVYLETADIYENISRLAKQVGYEPRGHVSAKTNVTITGTVTGLSAGDRLYVPAWKSIDTDKTYDGEIIKYSTTVASDTATVDASGSFTLNVTVIQGYQNQFTGYKGRDLVDNELFIPNYDFAHYEYEEVEDIISVTVDDEPWTRVDDFYEEISGLEENDDVYMFVYDRYERYKISFNESRNTPGVNDNIVVNVLRSLGINGGVAAGSITSPETNFLYNATTGEYVSNSLFTVSNSAASIGASDPEDISVIRENAKSILHAQERNVTKVDYISHLQERSDIVTANVWGEQDLYPSGGNISEYNRVYVTVYPTLWGTNTITTSSGIWTPTPGVSGTAIVPQEYSSSYENGLSEYLESRKILTTYEIFEVPDLIYFYFSIGVRLKRLYDFSDVSDAIRRKLIYWFSTSKRNFNEEIDFKDISEYLIDITQTSSTDTFEYIKGARNIIIRDIAISHTIWEENSNPLNYPQYTTTEVEGENKLRPILLGFNQYPILSIDTLSIVQES